MQERLKSRLDCPSLSEPSSSRPAPPNNDPERGHVEDVMHSIRAPSHADPHTSSACHQHVSAFVTLWAVLAYA